MTSSERDSQQVRIRVHPEPEAESMAVIVAAVHCLKRRERSGDEDNDVGQLSSGWSQAGRREAMSGRGEDLGHRGSW
ncbi:MAG: hypothetical protein M3451_05905 [Chloroflexota bacterium]|nr:hypothetical protein [Chloroflexota bacterium]